MKQNADKLRMKLAAAQRNVLKRFLSAAAETSGETGCVEKKCPISGRQSDGGTINGTACDK